MTQPAAQPEAQPLPRVLLVGAVAGVEACSLLTSRDEIVLGSGYDCDLTVIDPLVPRRAMRLRHVKEHAGPHHSCDACWEVEALGGTRIYVNHELTRRARLRFGDTLAVGCHQFRFLDGTSAARDRRSNTKVDDLCLAMLDELGAPAGFLHGRPNWRDRIRTWKAGRVGIALAVIVLLIGLLFAPKDELFEPIQPPMEIVMMAERVAAPPPDAVRSLDKVQRKTFDAPSDQPIEPLRNIDPQPLAEMDAQPIVQNVSHAAPPPPPEIRTASLDAAPLVAPAPTLAIDTDRVQLKRDAARLGTNAPARRLSVKEATNVIEQQELGKLDARVDKGAIASAASTKYAAELQRRRPEKPDVKLEAQRAEVLAALSRVQATPVETQDYRGIKIPVARVPESLPSLAIAEGAKGFEIDGQITDAEVAMSFKTGRFKLHGPNPAEADPATYCYVGKVTIDGKDHLYVSFDCRDPNLGALVARQPDGSPHLAQDDSIEFFIDINGDRNDYHQLIVNAQGRVFSTYCPTGDAGINGLGSAWNSGVKTKVTVNPEGQRWICEFTIPYSAFGAVPGKGTKVPVNFCRNFRGQGPNQGTNLQNWFLVYDGSTTNYHHPRLFGVLEWP